jgi:phenylacetate-CoA ligase
LYNYFRIAYDLASLLRHTHWSREQLLDYQNMKVQEIVRYAFDNVPFYHEKFLQAGVKPTDVKTVDDLKKLPILRREELQKAADKVISNEFDSRRLKHVSTSGSTGQPLFTYITAREDAFRKAKLLRANTICGQKPRDKWVVMTAPQHEAQTSRLQRFLGVYSPIPVSVFDSVAVQISEIERIKPDVLDGYSSSLLLLAEEVERRGLETIRPRMVVGGAELIDSSSRHFVERVFKAPFYDEYASVEFERLAWQCEERAEYHIDADSVLMEFLDKENAEVARGETGEIVCTSLFNYAMPLIRYATGDIGRDSKETGCACGRAFPLMKVMEGRKESVVVLPDGRSLSPLAIGDCMCAFKYFNNVFQYRFIQKKVNSFKILVKKKDASVDDKIMKTEMLRHVRGTLRLSGAEVDVEIEFTDEIPPDKSGKIRKVVSELK